MIKVDIYNPKSCEDCPFFEYHKHNSICRATIFGDRVDVEWGDYNFKPDWCPIIDEKGEDEDA